MTSQRSREAKTNGKIGCGRSRWVVSGMSGDLAELLSAAKTGGATNAEEILKDDEFVDAN